MVHLLDQGSDLDMENQSIEFEKGTELDALAIGNQFLMKEEQDPLLAGHYKDKNELD